jgi:uncharacterized membrane protein YphA (DoxX/SURF4 family)
MRYAKSYGQNNFLNYLKSYYFHQLYFCPIILNIKNMTSKTKNIFTWVLAGLLAFAFLGSGITKLLGVEMQIKNLESWGYPLWMRFPIGLSEILFAIGLLIPAYRKLIVFGVFGWGLIAIYTHIQATPPQTQMLAGPIVFLLLNTALFFLSKANSKSLN